MKKFIVQYGHDIRDLSNYETLADNHRQAINNFRKEMGYDYIKIQYIIDTIANKKYYSYSDPIE